VHSIPVAVAKERRPVPALPEVDGDESLALRLRGGDRSALAEIYRRHRRHLAGVVFRLMGDAVDLEDVVQETFAAALEGIAGLREPASLKAWLVGIAVRRVRRRLRLRTLRRLVGMEIQRGANLAYDPGLGVDVHALGEALGRLAPRLRIPWVLHRVEGFSLPEVARAVGASLATVKRRVALAEQRIERRLHAG